MKLRDIKKKGSQLIKEPLLVFLFIVLLASVIRIFGYAFYISRVGMQRDFSAFYTAGKAVNAGLSPYVNYLTTIPGLWDGVASFTHSRFLYPPIVADLFRILALFPYSSAKLFWTLLNLVCVITTVVMFTKEFRLSLKGALLAAIFSLTFFPLLTLLERGQIDGITLLLVGSSIIYISKSRSSNQYAAGVLLALATMLKLYSIFFIPFLLIRKKWRALLSFCISGLVIVFFMILPSGGLNTLSNYIENELPRISLYGEIGPDELKIPEQKFQDLIHITPRGTVDGIKYQPAVFSFTFNASLARAISPNGINLNDFFISLSLFSSTLYLLAFTLISWMILASKRIEEIVKNNEILFFTAILVLILLVAPLTWVMNTVWVLPLIVILIHFFEVGNGLHSYALTALCLGLFLMWLPDSTVFSLLIPFGHRFEQYKYVVGEAMIFVGLLWTILLDTPIIRSSRSNVN